MMVRVISAFLSSQRVRSGCFITSCFVLSVVGASTASAAITACPNTAGTDALLSTYTTGGTPGAATGSIGTGCSSINVSFDNISLTATAPTGAGVAQTNANNAIFATGTAASGNTVGPVSITFDPETTNWQLAASGTTGATIGYEAISHTGPSVPYGASPSNPALQWDFSTITLTPTGCISGGLGNGASITVQMTVCLSASGTSACDAAHSATVTGLLNTQSSTFNFTCLAGGSFAGSCGSATSATLTLNPHPTQIAISDTYTFSRTNGSASLTLTNFTNTFGESADTPEPSTLILMSGALLGLGALVRRRKA